MVGTSRKVLNSHSWGDQPWVRAGIAHVGFSLRGGGGGVNRAPKSWGGGGGVGKRAQLTDTILTNEKVRIHIFRDVSFLKILSPLHPPLLTCLSAHALECGWEAPTLAHLPLCPCAGVWMGGPHPCSRASLPMRWSVDGRHPPLLTCLSAHALERGWEAPTLADVPL